MRIFRGPIRKRAKMACTLVVAVPTEDYSEAHAQLCFLWRLRREGVHDHRGFRRCGV
jgi:hypothetical protein